MIVERRITHHSICLDETILMSYSASFYDHWMPSYSAKRQIVQNLLIYPTHIGYPICTRYSALIIHISYIYRVPDISFFDQCYNKGYRKKLAFTNRFYLTFFLNSIVLL